MQMELQAQAQVPAALMNGTSHTSASALHSLCESPFAQVEGTHVHCSHKWSCAHMHVPAAHVSPYHHHMPGWADKRERLGTAAIEPSA